MNVRKGTYALLGPVHWTIMRPIVDLGGGQGSRPYDLLLDLSFLFLLFFLGSRGNKHPLELEGFGCVSPRHSLVHPEHDPYDH